MGAITILHELVSESLGQKRKVYACFIDLQKAFDYADRDILVRKMISASVNRKFASLIKKPLQQPNVNSTDERKQLWFNWNKNWLSTKLVNSTAWASVDTDQE